MFFNRRKWYYEKLAGFLSLHPEQVNTFISYVCDEIGISDLDAIYRQMQEVSKQPLTSEQIKNLRN